MVILHLSSLAGVILCNTFLFLGVLSYFACGDQGGRWTIGFYFSDSQNLKKKTKNFSYFNVLLKHREMLSLLGRMYWNDLALFGFLWLISYFSNPLRIFSNPQSEFFALSLFIFFNVKTAECEKWGRIGGWRGDSMNNESGRIQAYLGERAGLVPEHWNKAIITMKQVTWIFLVSQGK